MDKLISVVIPTRDRPKLVKRAVESALGQTLQEIEVIVVIDGIDSATFAILAAINDPRLQIVQLPTNRGGSGARNAGVKKAQGKWVAFLDDDDEWLPQKLELQLAAARKSQYKYPIISCCLTARTPKGEFTYPKRFPRAREPLSEYLLARNSLSFGEGLVQTSTIFTARELLQQVPFLEDLPKHQDWDWLLRADLTEGVELKFIPKQLVIWYLWENRQSTSSTSNWHNSLAWIQANRHLVTPRAYSGFLTTQVAPQAAREKEWGFFFPLLQESLKFGRLTLLDFWLYLGMWLIPRDFRRSLRVLFKY